MLTVRKNKYCDVDIRLALPGFTEIVGIAQGITTAAQIVARGILETIEPYLGTGREGIERALREGFTVLVRDWEDNPTYYRLGDEEKLFSRLKTDTPPYHRIDICNGDNFESLTISFTMDKHDNAYIGFMYTDKGENVDLCVPAANDDDDFKEKLTSSIYACLLIRFWKEHCAREATQC